jgi:hypothetical protein
MKQILTLLAICLAITSFGQERRTKAGLNRFIPDNVSAGIKGSMNIYRPSLKLQSSDASLTAINGNEKIGGGGGFYFRFDMKGHLCIQPEINVHFMSGSVHWKQTFTPDPEIKVTKSGVTSYSTLNVEVPVYLKWRQEITVTRRGHTKENSAISFFIGPRLIISPYSTQTVGKRTESVIYGERSEFVESVSDADPSYSPLMGMGAAVGVDLELWNGFIMHACYYRGILKNSLKSANFKSYENRFELGLGLRFK